MRKVLLTGFEPFGGAMENPSRRAVLAVAADPPEGVRLATEILPVSYRATGPALLAALRRHRPDVVIATGLAGGRAEISVERVAINVDDARIADNDGERRTDTPIVANGPAAYFATLPIKAVAAAIRDAGTPALVSQTAGTFLCNHVFYLACHFAATEAPGLRAGFLHLPWLAEQAAEHAGTHGSEPSMALSSIVAALYAAIAASCGVESDLLVAEGAVS